MAYKRYKSKYQGRDGYYICQECLEDIPVSKGKWVPMGTHYIWGCNKCISEGKIIPIPLKPPEVHKNVQKQEPQKPSDEITENEEKSEDSTEGI